MLIQFPTVHGCQQKHGDAHQPFVLLGQPLLCVVDDRHFTHNPSPTRGNGNPRIPSFYRRTRLRLRFLSGGCRNQPFESAEGDESPILMFLRCPCALGNREQSFREPRFRAAFTVMPRVSTPSGDKRLQILYDAGTRGTLEWTTLSPTSNLLARRHVEKMRGCPESSVSLSHALWCPHSSLPPWRAKNFTPNPPVID